MVAMHTTATTGEDYTVHYIVYTVKMIEYRALRGVSNAKSKDLCSVKMASVIFSGIWFMNRNNQILNILIFLKAIKSASVNQTFFFCHIHQMWREVTEKQNAAAHKRLCNILYCTAAEYGAQRWRW